jgi:hypothetical protein
MHRGGRTRKGSQWLWRSLIEAACGAVLGSIASWSVISPVPFSAGGRVELINGG